MENKELVSAGNALVSWFNSQEINSADAQRIMLKVLAKLMVDRSDHSPNPEAVQNEMDELHRILAHELIDRLHNRRSRR